MANVISLGIVCGLVEFDSSLLKNVLSKVFGKKGAEIIKLNENVMDIGYESLQVMWRMFGKSQY